MANDIFTGGPSGSPIDWSVAAAWSNGLPGSSAVVEQTGSATDASVTQIGGLVLDNGADLTIYASTQLTVTGAGDSAFGGGGSTIYLTDGFLTVDASVTSATGDVVVEGDGLYQYNGTGADQTVSNAWDFLLGGSDNNDAVTVQGIGFYRDEGTGNGGTVNLEGGQFAEIGTNATMTVNMSGGGLFSDFSQFNGTVQDLNSSGQVVVEDGSGAGSNATTHSISGNDVTLHFQSGDSYTLNFDSTANLTITANGTQFDITSSTVCFVTGTRIRTARGQVAVEELNVTDLAVTSSGEARPITWIGQRTVRGPERALWPVRVMAGAFGEGAPVRDLYLSPGHAVCVNVLDEMFIPIGDLVNGGTIAQVKREEVTYWHVELESHDVLLAEGLRCESYLDVGNRQWFGREHGRLQAIDPERPAETNYARPFVDEGPIVEVVRQRLAARAEVLGWRATPDMDLHLIVDGVRIEPDLDGDLARFVFPVRARDARLVSRTFTPGSDPRSLGVRIDSLYVFSDGLRLARRVQFDEVEGFHPEEIADGEPWRWTDGELPLPADLWAGCRGQVTLRLDFDTTPHCYWIAPERRAAEPVGKAA